MRKILSVFGLLFSFNLYADTASDIKQLVIDNLRFTTEENVQGVMNTIHRDSLFYTPTHSIMMQVFTVFDLKYSLISYDFIHSDDEYAYVKVTQKTEKIAGPEFRNNEFQVLHVLKKENGVWKFWAQATLAMKYL